MRKKKTLLRYQLGGGEETNAKRCSYRGWGSGMISVNTEVNSSLNGNPSGTAEMHRNLFPFFEWNTIESWLSEWRMRYTEMQRAIWIAQIQIWPQKIEDSACRIRIIYYTCIQPNTSWPLSHHVRVLEKTPASEKQVPPNFSPSSGRQNPPRFCEK